MLTIGDTDYTAPSSYDWQLYNSYILIKLFYHIILLIHFCPKCGAKLGEYIYFRMDRIWQKNKKHRQAQHKYKIG